jgi:hypothetical protein
LPIDPEIRDQNDSIMPLAFAHLDSLNTEQRRAEGDYALSGLFLVIASAGSGDIGTPVQMAYLRSSTLAIFVRLGGAAMRRCSSVI